MLEGFEEYVRREKVRGKRGMQHLVPLHPSA